MALPARLLHLSFCHDKITLLSLSGLHWLSLPRSSKSFLAGSALAGIRTQNLQFSGPVLYPLSYEGKFFG